MTAVMSLKISDLCGDTYEFVRAFDRVRKPRLARNDAGHGARRAAAATMAPCPSRPRPWSRTSRPHPRCSGLVASPRRIAVLQHVPFEGPGAIADWAEARGHALDRVALHRGEPVPRRGLGRRPRRDGRPDGRRRRGPLPLPPRREAPAPRVRRRRASGARRLPRRPAPGRRPRGAGVGPGLPRDRLVPAPLGRRGPHRAPVRPRARRVDRLPLARRHLRAARGHGPPRLERRVREPGLRLARGAGDRPPVPPRDAGRGRPRPRRERPGRDRRRRTPRPDGGRRSSPATPATGRRSARCSRRCSTAGWGSIRTWAPRPGWRAPSRASTRT